MTIQWSQGYVEITDERSSTLCRCPTRNPESLLEEAAEMRRRASRDLRIAEKYERAAAQWYREIGKRVALLSLAGRMARGVK